MAKASQKLQQSNSYHLYWFVTCIGEIISISMEQTIISAFSQPLVSVLLNNFIEEAVSVVHFRNNFLAMCEQLEFVRLVLDSMLNLQNTSNSIKH
jgi:hypothetical protein